MANEILTTLHPDQDPDTNLYPNIKKDNIPNKSIDTNKLDDNVLSLMGSLKPSGTDSTDNILAFTTNKGIYIATSGTLNGHWLYWNGSQYVDGGVYQATEIPDNSITTNKIANNNVTLEKLTKTINIDLSSYNLVQGSISGGGGFVSSTNRVILYTGYRKANTLVSVMDYNYDVNYCIDDNNVIGDTNPLFVLNKWVKSFKTTLDGYLMIVIRKTDNTDFTPNDIDVNKVIRIEEQGVVLSKNYIDRNSRVRDKYFHFSLDDFYLAFQDITNHQDTYTSIYDNSTFSFLKSLHDLYGCVISCYCYLENETYSLSNVTTKFKQDFMDAKEWLKFGIHAHDGGTNFANTTYEDAYNYYTTFVNAIINITGTYECIDVMPRLHNFAGNLDSIQALRNHNCGIVGALGADDTRQSYYLNENEYNYLFNHERFYDSQHQLMFVTTDIRLERDGLTPFVNMQSNASWGSKSKELIVFTHEWALSTQQDNIISAVNYAYVNDYDFDYPQNRR